MIFGGLFKRSNFDKKKTNLTFSFLFYYNEKKEFTLWQEQSITFPKEKTTDENGKSSFKDRAKSSNCSLRRKKRWNTRRLYARTKTTEVMSFFTDWTAKSENTDCRFRAPDGAFLFSDLLNRIFENVDLPVFVGIPQVRSDDHFHIDFVVDVCV